MQGRSARRRAALCVHALLAAALIPGFAVLASTHWRDPGLLVALLAIGICAEPAEVKLTNGVRLDGTIAIGLLALVLAGPLAAFLVLFVPVVTSATVLWRLPFVSVTHKPLLRAGNLSNLASYGWATIAAGGTLTLTGAQHPSLAAVPALLLAGLTFEAGQLALGPCVHETLWNGYRLAEILKVAVVACWADLLMIVMGVATAVLIVPLGIGALALSMAMTLTPGAVPAAVRARAASQLALDAATKLYADALATVMGLARGDRELLPVLIDVVGYVRAHDDAERERFARAGLAPPSLDPAVERCLKEAICSTDPAAYATLAVDECWDGSGPTGLRTERAPLGARIIAVAEAWSALTAKGGPELSHEQALAKLAADAGSRFDPLVVDAVAVVVERERRLSAEPAFQPRVHRLPRALQIPVLRVGAQLSA